MQSTFQLHRLSVSRGTRVCALLLFSLIATSCGGGGGSSAGAPCVVSSIEIRPGNASITVSGQQQFGAFDQTGKNISCAPVQWSSSGSASIATINSSGLATAGTTAGAVNITARIGNLISNPAILTVTAGPLVTIAVTPISAAIQVVQTQQFAAVGRDANGNQVSGLSFTWTSLNDTVASISASGLAQGLVPGSTNITANVGSIVSNNAVLTVQSEPPAVGDLVNIEVTPTEATIQVGQTQQFAAVGRDADGKQVSGLTFEWTSSNTTTASISSSGLATGEATGSVTITAKVGTITSNEATIIVTAQTQLDDVLLYPAGVTPIGIAVGDFIVDQKQDVAVVNLDSSSVLLYPGDGEGNLGNRTPLLTGSQPVAVVAADVDNDGKIDLVTLNSGDPDFSEPPSLTVFRSAFAFAPSSIPLTGGTPPPQIPFGMAAGDFNGDGNVDLVISDVASGNVFVLLGRGNGTFATPQQTSVGCAPSAIVAGKFRGPSATDDAAVVCPTSDSLVILTGKFSDIGGGSLFTGEFNPSAHTTGDRPVGLALKDIDKDERLDIVVVNQGDESLEIFLGDGLGGFLPFPVPSISVGSGTQPVAVAAGDIDGDGNIDLAVANSGSNNITLLFGDGTGNFPDRVDRPSGRAPSAIAAAFLNGNNQSDLLVTTAGDNRLYVYLDAQRP